MNNSRKKISFEFPPTLPFEEEEFVERNPYKSNYPLLNNSAAMNKKDFTSVPIVFLSMGSGSSGNCCYVGTRQSGILIDAGVKAEDVEKYLRNNGLDIKNVRGLLLTHDHSDHVRYAYTLLRRNRHLRLFCTNRVLGGLLRRHSISRRIKDYHQPIFKEIPFTLAGIETTAFDVPHDGTDNMGFSLNFGDRHFVLATDLGAVTERANHYMSQADYLVIEANYDLEMLLKGRYPEHLKARIQTQFGHMDNKETARYLQSMITSRLKHIFLCHLSQDNNKPELALNAVRQALEEKGKKVGEGENTIADRQADVQLSVLPRFEATRLYVFLSK